MEKKVRRHVLQLKLRRGETFIHMLVASNSPQRAPKTQPYEEDMEDARLADTGPAVLDLQWAAMARPCTSCLKESEDMHDLLMNERSTDDGLSQARLLLQELIFAHCEFLLPPTIR